MKRIHGVLLLSLAFAAALASGSWLWHTTFTSAPLQCVGDVYWNIGDNRFTGTVSFRMSRGEGLAMIEGKLFGQHSTDVSRNIYFSYTQQRHARVLKTTRIVKTFADSADEEDISSTLPGFYRQQGRELSLMIDEYKSAYIFAISNVPSLYCRKN